MMATTLTVALTATPAAHAAGAPLVVTTTTDAADPSPADGVCASTLPGAPCTLRAAVQTANARPGFDAIAISPAIARPTTDPDCTTNWLGAPDREPAFHLTVLGQGEDAAATGDLDVTGPTSIADACNITVDGDRNDRVWDVRSTLELTNVQTTSGVAPSSELAGSGIAVRPGASLTIHGGNVNNSGFSDTGIGGDIYAGRDTNVLLDDTNINTGSAEFGGGIYTEGHLEINGSVLDDHGAKQGGGLFLAGGSTAVVRDVFMIDSSTAGFGGGGAHVFAAPGSHATFIHSVFGGASVFSDGTGGVFHIDEGATVGIVASSILGGTAQQGGAIYNAGDLSIVDSGISGGSAATGNGGGIWNDVTGHLNMQRSVAFGNNANFTLGNGGFLYNVGSASIANSSIGSSSAENQGSGIWTGGPLDLSFSVIANSIANTGPGAGLYVSPGTQDVRVADSAILLSGAGVSPVDCAGAVTLVGTLITNVAGCTDSATQPGGGAAVQANPPYEFTSDPNNFGPTNWVVPQFATTSTIVDNAADQAECSRVRVDGHGAPRLANGATTCDVGPIEKGAVGPTMSVVGRSDQATAVPAFSSLPLDQVPSSALTGALVTSGADSTESAPIARVDFSAPLTGTAQPETTPIARVPIARVPIARVPIARVPIARVGLAQIPIARVPIARVANDPNAIDTWDELLAGSKLADRPLASVTMADVLDPANWPPGGLDHFISVFEAMTLGQVDLSQTVIGRLSPAALSEADVPLSEVSIEPNAPRSADPNTAKQQNLQAWCAYFTSTGFSCDRRSPSTPHSRRRATGSTSPSSPSAACRSPASPSPASPSPASPSPASPCSTHRSHVSICRTRRSPGCRSPASI